MFNLTSLAKMTVIKKCYKNILLKKKILGVWKFSAFPVVYFVLVRARQALLLAGV